MALLCLLIQGKTAVIGNLIDDNKESSGRLPNGRLGTLGGTSNTYSMVFFKENPIHKGNEAFSPFEAFYRNKLQPLQISEGVMTDEMVELANVLPYDHNPEFYEVARVIAELAIQQGNHPPYKLEFLAKSLIQGECYANNEKRRVILGTPLYVALVGY